MRKMKTISRIVGMFCTVFFLSMFIPAEPVFAAENLDFNKTSVISIPAEQSKEVTGAYTWIKYKAKNHGYITITAENILPTNTVTSTDTTVTVKDPVTGVQTVQPRTYATGSVRLFNSKKAKTLSSKDSFQTVGGLSTDTSVVYGVKKGTTYYVRVASVGDVKLKLKFNKVKESSGTKASKAKPIKKNKKIKGIIPAGEKAADWYKIVIPKKQILHIYYSGKTNNRLKITFMGEYLETAQREVIRGVTGEQHAYTIERVQPGTYYVKVERNNSKSSGYYTIRWK